jgi:hypothetical protein
MIKYAYQKSIFVDFYAGPAASPSSWTVCGRGTAPLPPPPRPHQNPVPVPGGVFDSRIWTTRKKKVRLQHETELIY